MRFTRDQLYAAATQLQMDLWPAHIGHKIVGLVMPRQSFHPIVEVRCSCGAKLTVDDQKIAYHDMILDGTFNALMNVLPLEGQINSQPQTSFPSAFAA